MIVLGVTGGVGSGKSLVLAYLKQQYGAYVLLTDEVGKELQQPGQPCLERLVEHFGSVILDENGGLDRKEFANIIFSDDEALKYVNSIIHPAVKNEVVRQIKEKEAAAQQLFVIESALLLDDRYDEICDQIWFISVSPEIRAKRLKASRGYDDEKIKSIMDRQMSMEEFQNKCQVIIDNSRDFEQTKEKIDQVMKELTEGLLNETM